MSATAKAQAKTFQIPSASETRLEIPTSTYECVWDSGAGGAAESFVWTTRFLAVSITFLIEY